VPIKIISWCRARPRSGTTTPAGDWFRVPEILPDRLVTFSDLYDLTSKHAEGSFCRLAGRIPPHLVAPITGNPGRFTGCCYVGSPASRSSRPPTIGYSPAERAGADPCAVHLTAKQPYLAYHTTLAVGWPIATGVIDDACRHIVKDGMDITGAGWRLQGAEAILKLRALISNGDFDDYWNYHLRQERQRIHQSRYRNKVTLAA